MPISYEDIQTRLNEIRTNMQTLGAFKICGELPFQSLVHAIMNSQPDEVRHQANILFEKKESWRGATTDKPTIPRLLKHRLSGKHLRLLIKNK